MKGRESGLISIRHNRLRSRRSSASRTAIAWGHRRHVVCRRVSMRAELVYMRMVWLRKEEEKGKDKKREREVHVV